MPESSPASGKVSEAGDGSASTQLRTVEDLKSYVSADPKLGQMTQDQLAVA